MSLFDPEFAAMEQIRKMLVPKLTYKDKADWQTLKLQDFSRFKAMLPPPPYIVYHPALKQNVEVVLDEIKIELAIIMAIDSKKRPRKTPVDKLNELRKSLGLDPVDP